MTARDLENLARARGELGDLDRQRMALRVQLGEAEAELDKATRAGQSQATVRRLQTAVDRFRRAGVSIDERRQDLTGRIADLRDRLRQRDPEQSVAQLDGGVPVCLLPVRLETRFADGATRLRIRIYPEQVHVDTHEPALTDDEVAAGQQYWLTRWGSADDDLAAPAWLTLAKATRPTRARWIVQACTPTNVAQLGIGEPSFPDVDRKSAPWTRAPMARLLPEQWVAIGYRGGREIFRRWGTPVDGEVAVGLAPDLDDPDDGEPIPDVQDELPIDDGMRWMVDYDAAVDAGMAITVTNDDLRDARLAAGVDQLVVLGVDWSLEPQAGAQALAAHLDRHAVTDGLAVLGPGTATNNTDDERAGPETDPLLDPAAYDPATPPINEAAARVAEALGAGEADGLLDAPGSGSLDDQVAADMATVLWAPTFGYFFDQIARPLVSTDTADDVRDHVNRYVRGGGPYPALRIGRQPYGVLPVMTGIAGRAGPPGGDDDPLVNQLSTRLDGLRFLWQRFGDHDPVPELGLGDRADADLIELLRRTPRSQTFRFREASKPTYWSSIFGFDLIAQVQEQIARILLGLADVPTDTELTSIVADPRHRAVPVPLVTFDELSETETLDPNYITGIHRQTTMVGGFKQLLARPSSASTLLQALLRHAASLEVAIGTTALVIDHEITTRVLLEKPRVASIYDREIHDVEFTRIVDSDLDADGSDAPSASLLSQVTGVVELADQSVRAISGNRSLADFLSSASDRELIRRVVTRRYAEFRQALARLADAPTAELQRQAADTLDCSAHRLDAWITSTATRQLDRIRATDKGTHIGAFGYVENLEPDSRPDSLGYIHGPSVAHATTAAILRSGHLARGQDDDGLLAIDLGSIRVQRGLELLTGVRNGQPIGALLGYRFERGLRDRRITLARYILPFRRVAPLASSSVGPDDGEPVEAIAARDVVDGLELLERWKANRLGLFASAGVSAADRGDIDAVLSDIDDALDAVSDLLMTESVHQAVMGNAERSAAALDALDRQEAIPDIGFVRTPRTGLGYQHRLVVLSGSSQPADGWEGLDDPRRAAEPRLDRWVGTVLGDPDRVRFGAEVLDGDGVVVQTVTARLPDLGLSALATVMASVGAGDTPSELEERLAIHLGGQVSADGAAQLVLLEDPPVGSAAGSIGLRQVLDLGTELNDLLASARAADARDLADDTERPDAGHDAAELQARADAAVAALTSASGDLAALDLDDPGPAVGAALLQLADAGQRAAIVGGSDPADALAVAEQALANLTRLANGFDRPTATVAASIAHDLARLRAVFGESFPAVAVFKAANGDALDASAADDGLLGGDPLAAATWLTRHGLVRPAGARLVDVLEASEMLGGGTGLDQVTVAQLPRLPGDRWIGLPLIDAADGSDPRPSGATAVVAHLAPDTSFTDVVAGLVIDQWTDVIPNDHETTGLSFHYDAPGARAPQTILLAVPSDLSADSADAGWSVDALAATVTEAMDLARMRAYDLDDLAAVGRFLPAVYLPFNLEAKTPNIDLTAIIAEAVRVQNIAFLEQERS